ncbi:MAG: TolC family protein [Sulfuricellaceae bacterium]|nr:TolC family protein [Sulfuricellaceae bacterium]
MFTGQIKPFSSIVIGLIALSIGLPLVAAESIPVDGALATALELAWARHPQAASMAARGDEARATVERANALSPEPASIGFGNLNDRLNSKQGKNEFELELGVPLWLPGQRAARLSEAESRVGLVAAQQAALKHQLASEIRAAWWALAMARVLRQLAEQRLDTARALAESVQRRFRAGDLSRIDANLAQSERLDAEAGLIETDNALLVAEQAFRMLTGIAPPGQLAEETGKSALSNDAHPQLIFAMAATQTARARVRAARHETRAAPELSLRVERNRDNNQEVYDNSVGLRFKFPLSSGAQVRQGNAQAQAEASEADAELARLSSKLDLAASRAKLELSGAETQLALSQTRLELNTDNLRLSEKSFALGETDLATLLRIRAAAFDAKNQHERQRIARAAAISNLNQALGVLP